MLTGDTKCRPLPGMPPSAGLPAPNLASGAVNGLPGVAGMRASACPGACQSIHACLSLEGGPSKHARKVWH